MRQFKSVSTSFFFLVLLITSCEAQSKDKIANDSESILLINQDSPIDPSAQIGQYIIESFEDRKGNLWFGTLEKGVARYDGKALRYFTTANGLAGNTVASIVEDKEGNLWFGTRNGLSKYDGKTFTNFTKQEGLCYESISHIFIDQAGNIWIGTWEGVCLYDGKTFSKFPLPIPDIEVPSYQATTNWITEIMEDKQGNIWFSRSGYGLCRYDGDHFTQYSKEDGLASNCVHITVEDKQGNIWLGSRIAEKDHPDPDKRKGDGGLNKYDGKTFIQYPQIEGLNENDIYAIYEDQSGNIWIGANDVGLYRYDGENFTLFDKTDQLEGSNNIRGIQNILEDRNGTIWVGCSGGLFRLSGSTLINVTQGGPWK